MDRRPPLGRINLTHALWVWFVKEPSAAGETAYQAADAAASAAEALESLLAALAAVALAASDAATAASVAVAADLAPGGAIPKFHRMIGVTENGVEGVDVERGSCEITITKKWDKAILPAGYLKILADYNAKSCVNDAPYTINYFGQVIPFPRGTLRFKVASIKIANSSTLDISYSFAYDGGTTTADNFTIGNSAPIVMEGHHHIWIRSIKKKSTAPGTSAVVEVPQSAHVVQIYPYKSFAPLAI